MKREVREVRVCWFCDGDGDSGVGSEGCGVGVDCGFGVGFGGVRAGGRWKFRGGLGDGIGGGLVVRLGIGVGRRR